MKRVESNPHTFVTTKVINRENKTLIIPTYVDDLFPFGDKVLTDNFEAFIPNYFETTPPCDTHYFLGICVTRSRAPLSNTTVRPYISLDQITFIGKVLKSIEEFYPEHTITNRRTVLPATPIEPNTQPKMFTDPKRVRRFQSTVGQLMYIMLATRPDLAYPVGMLARYTSHPSPDHEKALLHLASYLKHTAERALVYRKPTKSEEKPGLIEAWTDANWAGEEHSARSTLGMIIYKNDSAIAWGSKRQGIVSRSTMESEYIALFITANHIVLIFALETQFGLEPLQPYIWYDNQAAISIATGGGMNFKCSRFMNIKYHWVRKAYEGKEFYINYVDIGDRGGLTWQVH